MDLTNFDILDEYREEPILPEEGEVQLEASRRVLERYGEHREGDTSNPRIAQTLNQLLPGALRALADGLKAKTTTVDPDVLNLCAKCCVRSRRLRRT